MRAGSVCSGIEAASVSLGPLGFDFQWFSEIAPFPSKVLAKHYPEIPNVGDMTNIPDLIRNGSLVAPDFICGGTPCQAFSLAGWRNGLEDDRGNLALKFVEIAEASDEVRMKASLTRSIIFWENVDGVLTDDTNAFGCLISSLAGFNEIINAKKWPSAGCIFGPSRNVAWRVMDAKFFGLPQQRKRLYLLAGGTDFYPENVLFELGENLNPVFPKYPLFFEKEGHSYQVFREYTDCLYAAYGTKWNGNAAANNGSLFIVQDGRIRRFSPLETERLMGFPDNYSLLPKEKKTAQYQAVGNSWAVPVIEWIGKRILAHRQDKESILNGSLEALGQKEVFLGCDYYLFDTTYQKKANRLLNVSSCCNSPKFGNLFDVASFNQDETIFISPVGCFGILRRANERHIRLNPELKIVLERISSEMKAEDIEAKSRIQHRASDFKTWEEKKPKPRGRPKKNNIRTNS